MKALSLFACTLAFFGLVIAFSMDTSVVTPNGVRVINLGLMSDRQSYLIASGFLLIVGTILFGFSNLKEKEGKKQSVIKNGMAIVFASILGAVGLWANHSGRTENVKPESTVQDAASTARIPGRPSSEGFVLQLDTFTTSLAKEELAGQEIDSYIQIKMGLQVSSRIDAEDVKQYMPEIRNVILQLLEKKKSSQLSNQGGKDQLADEICTAVNKIVGKNKVTKTLFFSFQIS